MMIRGGGGRRWGGGIRSMWDVDVDVDVEVDEGNEAKTLW
jgi:hypothetical protein